MNHTELYKTFGVYVFERMLKGGFQTVAFGRGKLMDGREVIVLLAFFHDDGRIVTHERHEVRDEKGKAVNEAFEHEYSREEFYEYRMKHQVTLIEAFMVDMLLDEWKRRNKRKTKKGSTPTSSRF